MPDEPQREEEASRWLREPVEPGQVVVSIAVGEGADLPPALREALERFIMERAGVTDATLLSGPDDPKAPCSPYHVCSPQGSCRPLTTGPCRTKAVCYIEP